MGNLSKYEAEQELYRGSLGNARIDRAAGIRPDHEGVIRAFIESGMPKERAVIVAGSLMREAGFKDGEY